jgi:hypothetical protein
MHNRLSVVVVFLVGILASGVAVAQSFIVDAARNELQAGFRSVLAVPLLE